MRIKHLLLPLSLLMLSINVQAQSANKLAKKAQKYYQFEKYAKAIPLFERALAKDTTSTWLYKLANSYRSINQTAKAQPVYQAYLETAKEAKPKAHYELAQVFICNGEYDSARVHLDTFIYLDPIHGTNADHLLRNLDKIKDIEPYFEEVDITACPFNTDEDEHAAVFVNGDIMFTSDRKRKFSILKFKSGSTGREFLTMYRVPFKDTVYQKPILMPRKINSLNKNVGYSSISADGKTMIFSKNDIKSNSKNEFPMQLFQATLIDGKWKKVKKLNFCSNKVNYMHPAISPDGKKLVFASKKTNGQGGLDLYISSYKNGKWTRPANMGDNVNTTEHEGFPYIDVDGRVYFCSRGHLGYGGFDIFMTEINENQNGWKKPVNMGRPINSPQDDISICLDYDKYIGLVSSSRNGGDDDIFMFKFQGDKNHPIEERTEDGETPLSLKE